MASFKAKFPVLQELFAKPQGAPSGARVNSRSPREELVMALRELHIHIRSSVRRVMDGTDARRTGRYSGECYCQRMVTNATQHNVTDAYD